MPFLQRPGSVEGLPHPCVLAEEGLAVVLDPVQHLRTDTTRPHGVETFEGEKEAATRGLSKVADEPLECGA